MFSKLDSQTVQVEEAEKTNSPSDSPANPTRYVEHPFFSLYQFRDIQPTTKRWRSSDEGLSRKTPLKPPLTTGHPKIRLDCPKHGRQFPRRNPDCKLNVETGNSFWFFISEKKRQDEEGDDGKKRENRKRRRQKKIKIRSVTMAGHRLN